MDVYTAATKLSEVMEEVESSQAKLIISLNERISLANKLISSYQLLSDNFEEKINEYEEKIIEEDDNLFFLLCIYVFYKLYLKNFV